MKVFLAAPLFDLAEREFNYKIAKKLRESGFEVWLAQEVPYTQDDHGKEKRVIYEVGISALKTSNLVVAVLDGAEVDSGVACEIGYAKALGKEIIRLFQEWRRLILC